MASNAATIAPRSRHNAFLYLHDRGLQSYGNIRL